MPGYTAWRNWFLGSDSWALKKFKNSGSDQRILTAVQIREWRMVQIRECRMVQIRECRWFRSESVGGSDQRV
jgi:hypothetical protein